MTAAAKERDCLSLCREVTESKKTPMWIGTEDVVLNVQGVVFEILSIPIFMNNSRKYRVEINTTYPVVKFFSQTAVEDMLVGDSRQKAIDFVDRMIFDKMIVQKAYQALAGPVTKLHRDNLYLDFEKTKNAWSRGGPVVEVDQALLLFAKLVPLDIYNKRFLDRLDHEVFLTHLEFISLIRGQRLLGGETSEDIINFGV